MNKTKIFAIVAGAIVTIMFFCSFSSCHSIRSLKKETITKITKISTGDFSGFSLFHYISAVSSGMLLHFNSIFDGPSTIKLTIIHYFWGFVAVFLIAYTCCSFFVNKLGMYVNTPIMFYCFWIELPYIAQKFQKRIITRFILIANYLNTTTFTGHLPQYISLIAYILNFFTKYDPDLQDYVTALNFVSYIFFVYVNVFCTINCLRYTNAQNKLLKTQIQTGSKPYIIQGFNRSGKFFVSNFEYIFPDVYNRQSHEVFDVFQGLSKSFYLFDWVEVKFQDERGVDHYETIFVYRIERDFDISEYDAQQPAEANQQSTAEEPDNKTNLDTPDVESQTENSAKEDKGKEFKKREKKDRKQDGDDIPNEDSRIMDYSSSIEYLPPQKVPPKAIPQSPFQISQIFSFDIESPLSLHEEVSHGNKFSAESSDTNQIAPKNSLKQTYQPPPTSLPKKVESETPNTKGTANTNSQRLWMQNVHNEVQISRLKANEEVSESDDSSNNSDEQATTKSHTYEEESLFQTQQPPNPLSQMNQRLNSPSKSEGNDISTSSTHTKPHIKSTSHNPSELQSTPIIPQTENESFHKSKSPFPDVKPIASSPHFIPTGSRLPYKSNEEFSETEDSQSKATSKSRQPPKQEKTSPNDERNVLSQSII